MGMNKAPQTTTVKRILVRDFRAQHLTARRCPDCKVWTSNADHTCVVYDGPACHCGAGTTVAEVGAPGHGLRIVCRVGHTTRLS
jgi:hypothetical protein